MRRLGGNLRILTFKLRKGLILKNVSIYLKMIDKNVLILCTLFVGICFEKFLRIIEGIIEHSSIKPPLKNCTIMLIFYFKNSIFLLNFLQNVAVFVGGTQISNYDPGLYHM